MSKKKRNKKADDNVELKKLLIVYTVLQILDKLVDIIDKLAK